MAELRKSRLSLERFVDENATDLTYHDDAIDGCSGVRIFDTDTKVEIAMKLRVLSFAVEHGRLPKADEMRAIKNG